jgi:ATP-grasp domain
VHAIELAGELNSPVATFETYSPDSAPEPLVRSGGGSVLLVDSGWSHALPLAADFAKAGFRAYLLSRTRSLHRGFMPRGVTHVPRVWQSPEELLSIIDDCINTIEPDIVMPLSEAIVFDLWDQAPDWLPRVHPRIDVNRRGLYRRKRALGAFAQDHGVLIPQTRSLEKSSVDEIPSIIAELGLPIVVKGDGGAGGSQVRIVDSTDAAVRAVAELLELSGELPVLQQFLPGATYLVGGVFDRGRAVRLVSAEKTEMSPPLTGPAIRLASRHEPELIEAGAAVFGALGLSGIASADFVRGQDGRFRFLEVNPRPWGSYRFASALGIDVVGVWCRILRGEPVPSQLQFPADRDWTKMPDYLFGDRVTRVRMLRRFMEPVALRSWAWDSPKVLVHELFRAGVAFLRGQPQA